jgi:hypothetical protein
MSETPSGDEELETASVEPVSETPSEDDAARDDDHGVQSLQLCARLDVLEACTVELLRRFDESKRNMDRYYHEFLELETVVNQRRTKLAHGVRAECAVRKKGMDRLAAQTSATGAPIFLQPTRPRLPMPRSATLESASRASL